MKNIYSKLFFIIVGFVSSYSASAQVNINTELSDTELIEKLAGEGVRISNVVVNCPTNKSKKPYGYFTDNTGTLGVSDGLILTSGAAANAKGPNNSAASTQDNGDNDNNDPDLQPLVATGDKLNDVCSISFDIEVFSDTLIFNYVFGSEEYLEFVQDYHDVFGFFISGPGINGQKNIAVVPNTQLAVSVANINTTENSAYYINNGTGATPFVNLHVQYDGLTRVLQSKVAVRACQKYRLRLAIADVKDNTYDSGVFIEGRSFTTTGPKVRTNFTPKRFGHAIEGCYNGEFVFTRSYAAPTPLTIFYKVLGTATNGVDYEAIPTSITIPAGQKSAKIFIKPTADGIAEGDETVIIELLNNCPSLPPPSSATMTIREKFNFAGTDAQVCKGDSVQLMPSASKQFRYRWQNLDGSDGSYLSCVVCASPMSAPPATTQYKLLVIDTLTGCQTDDTVTVNVAERPKAAFTYGFNDQYTAMDIEFFNQSTNATSYFWDFGDGGTSSETSPIHFFDLPADAEEKEYQVKLTAFRQNPSCSDKDSSTVIKLVKRTFILPNIITVQNKDGKNDALVFKGIKDGVWQVTIFNRWGKIVYDDKAYKNDWKAEDVSSGVYFYLLQNPNRDRKFRGWLDVMK
jgi:PKD repeat protein